MSSTAIAAVAACKPSASQSSTQVNTANKVKPTPAQGARAGFSPLARTLIAAGLCALATGCVSIKGEHYLNHYGEADTGGYELSMDSAVYAGVMTDKPDSFADLSRFSSPNTSHRSGRTYVADTSGRAKMEHMYNRVDCRPTPGRAGWSDCAFSMREKGLNFTSWALDWKVVLQPDMEVLSSNHQRQVVRNGAPTLMWNFDGNRVNDYDVSFTVRVPNA